MAIRVVVPSPQTGTPLHFNDMLKALKKIAKDARKEDEEQERIRKQKNEKSNSELKITPVQDSKTDSN
jgi:hypothetical protein